MPNSLSRSFSIAAAVAAASPALTGVTLVSSSGVATSPIANACAPPVAALPCGSRAARALAVGSGTPPGAEIRTGAPTGAAISTEAAIAPCQSSSPTRVTAAGRWAGVVEGKVASATPAALEAGSAPPTRVVFLVAKAG